MTDKHVSPTIRAFRKRFTYKPYKSGGIERQIVAPASAIEQFITQIEQEAITRTLDEVEKELHGWLNMDDDDLFLGSDEWAKLKQRLTKGSKTEEYTKEGIKEYKDTLIKLGREE